MELPWEQLPQYGALMLFMYYTITNNREWRTYLTERNSKLEKSLDKLGDAIDRHFNNHGTTHSHN